MPTQSRCCACMQVGHFRASCPHTAARAAELFEAHRREMTAETVRQAVFGIRMGFLNAQPPHATPVPQYTPSQTPRGANENKCQEISNCKTEIQSILFDNSEKIPDGLYVQLMNALMIED